MRAEFSLSGSGLLMTSTSSPSWFEALVSVPKDLGQSRRGLEIRPAESCSPFLKPVKILLTKLEEIENLTNQWYPDDFLLRQQLFRLEVTVLKPTVAVRVIFV